MNAEGGGEPPHAARFLRPHYIDEVRNFTGII